MVPRGAGVWVGCKVNKGDWEIQASHHTMSKSWERGFSNGNGVNITVTVWYGADGSYTCGDSPYPYGLTASQCCTPENNVTRVTTILQ